MTAERCSPALALFRRWRTKCDYSRLPLLASELIGRHINVLVATGGDASARAASAASATIPVVFTMGGDPVKAGLVNSVNRPGGNVTGSVVLTETLEPKRLELLHEIVPGVELFGAIVNPTYPPAADQLRDLEAAVPKFGRRLLVAKASNDDELTKAFALMMRAGVGALLVTSDPFFDTRRRRIIEFAAQSQLPAIYQFREYAYEGGWRSHCDRIGQ